MSNNIWQEIYGGFEQVSENKIGWLIGIEQSVDGINATLASFDTFRMNQGGIPAFSFLLAYPKQEENGAVLLLRLIGSTPLRQDLARETLIQHYQNNPEAHSGLLGDNGINADNKHNAGLDSHTQTFLSFGGYNCQVLGSLYIKDGKIVFGADVEYLPAACVYTVINPPSEILERVIKIVKSSRPSSNSKIMENIGLGEVDGKKPSFEVGVLRYSATKNLQNTIQQKEIPIHYNYDEMISQRTAVFGMTRTGKSNMIKKIISNLQIGALKTNNEDAKISQLIFDINGEYANLNSQDSGSLADAFGNIAVVYKRGANGKDGVLEANPDFYNDLELGLNLIQKTIQEKNTGASSEAWNVFMSMSFENNYGDDKALEYLRKYLYRALLEKSGYKYDPIKNFHQFDISFFEKENQTGLLKKDLEKLLIDKNNFKDKVGPILHLQRRPEVHSEISSLIKLIAGQSGSGYIVGSGYISLAMNQHTSNNNKKEQLKSEEIIEQLKNGKLVIIDLSGSSPSSQVMLMREFAMKIFSSYTKSFTGEIKEKMPPCLIYVEEAHNMLGTKIPVDDIWPRIAKEGAKYGLGLVYATQEPSSIQTNILSNTENIVACHINNAREVREISQYFDFDVFANSLIRLQEPGYVRLKQRDMPFVLPVQVHEFKAGEVKKELEPYQDKYADIAINKNDSNKISSNDIDERVGEIEKVENIEIKDEKENLKNKLVDDKTAIKNKTSRFKRRILSEK